MSKFVLVKISLKEPVKTDLSYIQGSSIRGAYIRKYLIKNNINEDIALSEVYRDKLLSKKLIFSNAYPYVDNKCSIPTPLCFYTIKEKGKKFGKEIYEVDIKNEFEKNIEEGSVRINKKDFAFIDNKILKLVSVNRVENLHTRKVKKKDEINDTGDLFRYSAIDKNQDLYCFIKCDESMLDEVKSTIDNEIVYLGGSKGSGYGRCELNIIEDKLSYDDVINMKGIKNNTENLDNILNKNTLSIYFLSDAILKNELGQVCSHIEPKLLCEKLNINNVKYSKSSVLTTETNGYNAILKSSLPSVTAVKRGSILTYDYEGEISEDLIDKFEAEGIGSRKEEGYGQIVINPKFIADKCMFYEEGNITSNENINLDKQSKKMLVNIINTVNENRINYALNKLLFECIDSGVDKNSKKIYLSLNNSQIFRFLNTIEECEKQESDIKAKELITNFKKELKTKTKREYENKSKNKLFGYPLLISEESKGSNEFDFFDKLIDEEDVYKLTGFNITDTCLSPTDLNVKELNNFRLKLKLTKEILKYISRKNGGK